MNMTTVRNLALIAGAVGIGAVVLAACGKAETEPAEAANNLFRNFDTDGSNGVSNGESIKVTNGGAIESARQLIRRDSDGAYYRVNVGYSRVTSSIRQAVEAADQLPGSNRDGNATWNELSALAATFNRDGVATLNRDEKGAFEDTYRSRVLSRENIWTGTREYFVRDYPDTPSYPGGGGGGTSPGDTNPTPRPGNGGGSTSPGDDNPPSRPTPAPPSRPTPAPEPPTRPTPPPATSPGDSTDNGNPTEDDF